jgi:AraC-like DNA-binding protein
MAILKYIPAFFLFLAFFQPVFASGFDDGILKLADEFVNLTENQLLAKSQKGTDLEKIAAFYMLGKYYYAKPDFKQSYYFFQQALQILAESPAEKFRYKLLVNSGLALKGLGDYRMAINSFKLAEKYIKSDDRKESAFWTQDVAGIYFNWGKFDSAAIYSHKAEFLFKKENQESQLAAIYNQLGAIAHFYHLPEDALTFYQKAKSISLRFNLRKETVNSLVNLGIEYTGQNNFDEASNNLNEALKLAKVEKYQLGEIQALQSIATLFALKNDMTTALDFLEKSKHIAIHSGNQQLKSSILFNMATVFKLMHQNDKALQLYSEALKIQQSNNLTTLKTDLAIAEVYKLKGDLQKSLAYLENLRQNLSAQIDEPSLIMLEFQFAEIYLKLKEFHRAGPILLGLLDKIRKEKLVSYQEVEEGICLRLSEVFMAQGDAKLALYYHKEHDRIKTSAMEKRYSFGLARIQSESELFRLDHENRLLNAQNLAKSIEIAYERRKSFLLLAIILLVSASLVFISKQYLDKKKLNIELVKRNLELARQIPFQEIKETINELTGDELDKSKEIVKELIKLFEINEIYLQNDISLNQVAAQLNTNRTYLSKAIHDVLDTNFNALINKYRIEQARKLLSDPNQKMSIEGIANSVGFNSKSTFNAAFKSFTGLTPSVLRDEVLKTGGHFSNG